MFASLKAQAPVLTGSSTGRASDAVAAHAERLIAPTTRQSRTLASQLWQVGGKGAGGDTAISRAVLHRLGDPSPGVSLHPNVSPAPGGEGRYGKIPQKGSEPPHHAGCASQRQRRERATKRGRARLSAASSVHSALPEPLGKSVPPLHPYRK
jgi:hypothetical protein